MGCTESSYDASIIPLTGHKTGLEVISTPNKRYLKPETTVLKLREIYCSESGDEFVIRV